MKVTYRKTFLKELSRIPQKIRIKIEDFVFNQVHQASSIYEINKIEGLKGYKGYFKARFGLYRIGMQLEGDTLIFERVLHRKDIYRYYP